MLGRRAILDVQIALIALMTLAVLAKVRKVPEPLVILAAEALGITLRGVAS